MATSNACWGIELGAGAIKAMKLGRGSGGDVELLDFAVIPHKKVLSTPELDENQAMRVALGSLANQVDLSGASIAISVPGHSSFARFAKLPPIEPKPKQVANVVTFEARQQIPFELEQVEWDYQTFMSPDSPDVEVGIFAVTRERINQTLALLADVGITPAVVTVGPVAAYNGLAYDLQFTEDTPGTVILDVGTTSSDLIIADAGRVWVRTFPVGGHHFTEALVEKFKLSYSKAEKLKREGQKTQYARHVLQAMRPVFQDLAQDVQRSIGYYQTLHSDAKLVRLITLGSTFELPGLRKYLKQQLQMNVYRPDSLKRVSVDDQRAADLQATAPLMATAYGLALQGLDNAALQANLMPTPVIRQAIWRQKTKWFGVAAGVAIATAAAMFIRPFLDQQAVAGAPRASLIDEAIRDYEAARRNAQEVTAAADPDYTAANLIHLAEDNDTVANLFYDLDAMLAFAEQVNDEWEGYADGTVTRPDAPAVTVRALDMAFLAPGGEDAAEESPSRRDRRDRGGRRGRDSRGPTSQGLGDRGRPDTTGTDHPGFRLTLEVETWHPEPNKFIVRSLDRWIRDNAAREGVPYHLVAAPGQAWARLSSAVVGAGEEQAEATRRAPAARRDRDLELGLLGGGRQGIVGQGEVSGGSGGVIMTGPEGGGRGGGGGAAGSLEELAPIEGPPAPPEGTRISTYTISWDVVLGPAPEPETEPDEGGDA